MVRVLINYVEVLRFGRREWYPSQPSFHHAAPEGRSMLGRAKRARGAQPRGTSWVGLIIYYASSATPRAPVMYILITMSTHAFGDDRLRGRPYWLPRRAPCRLAARRPGASARCPPSARGGRGRREGHCRERGGRGRRGREGGGAAAFHLGGDPDARGGAPAGLHLGRDPGRSNPNRTGTMSFQDSHLSFPQWHCNFFEAPLMCQGL